ncbi:type IV pilus assembly protein PilF [Vibrio xiamenensis]|uniref:Type IV pilus assembly protein PilF n=1 Tax=Vibrio xiamenensis TaxID=861298 RepID=A0A1G7YIP9_9VIBR|nr:type IV pilus biogenesis/stability protein PilW [Vibrio xiamenensis]SDG95730.1 type IV pilus assembly protein PilF [Vibrio xiamenensis]
MKILPFRLLISAAAWLTLGGCAATSSITQQTQKSKADARIALAEAYLQQGEPSKAWKNLTLARQYSPDSLATQMALAHYYQQVGEMDSAEHQYQQAIERHSQSGELLNNYGAFICKQGRYLESLIWFAKARQQPGYAHIARNFENAGYCALKAQHLSEASDYFAKSVAHDPNRAQTWLTLIDLHIQLEQFIKAQQYLNRYKQRFGQDTHTHKRQGIITMMSQ